MCSQEWAKGLRPFALPEELISEPDEISTKLFDKKLEQKNLR